MNVTAVSITTEDTDIVVIIEETKVKTSEASK